MDVWHMALIPVLCTMPRDRVVATRIGIFACRTYPRATKTSKRANLCHQEKGAAKLTSKQYCKVSFNLKKLSDAQEPF